MAIVVSVEADTNQEWVDRLAELLPGDELWVWPDVPDRTAVEFAVMGWQLPLDELATYPNLEGVLLTTAGANHLQPSSALPDVPIVRLADPQMARDMAAWATHWVLHYHRDIDRYAAQQRVRRWEPHDYLPAEDVTVGILGIGTIGTIGTQMARTLDGFGYQVVGWSRSGRAVDDFVVFGGDDLHRFLAQCDIVINVLPLTPPTERLIDAGAFAAMRPGTAFINMGRGGTVDQHALLAALDSGHLRGAALDVVDPEPLPINSALWQHPGVSITPHISGVTSVSSASRVIATGIEQIRSGIIPHPLFDPHTGY